jgi:hypothetical protein
VKLNCSGGCYIQNEMVWAVKPKFSKAILPIFAEMKDLYFFQTTSVWIKAQVHTCEGRMRR